MRILAKNRISTVSSLFHKTEEKSAVSDFGLRTEIVRFFFLFLICLFLTGTAPFSSIVAQSVTFEPIPQQFYDDLEFEMDPIQLPEFPDVEVNISDLGAVSDGKTLNTEIFAQAIDSVHNQGGGTVIIPSGIWLTGPIELKSNVRLHTLRGAVVLFSDDFDLYPLIETSFEGLDTWRLQSPISAYKAENIAITGEGIFEGQGDSWRPLQKKEVTDFVWQQKIKKGGVLTENGETWLPTQNALKGFLETKNFNVPENRSTESEFAEIRDYLRPVLVSIRESSRVLLDGPSFQNSPAWNLHPLMSEHVVIRNLTIRNPEYAKNGDGLDMESCSNVAVYHNSFDCGDDGICIKSGKNEDGLKRNMPTQNVIIRENIVYKAHGGFVVGSEMSGGVRNVHVSNMNFIGTDVGLRFKSTRGRGGVVENIFISNINMIDIVTEPLRFNLYYDGEAPSPNQKSEIVDKKKAREEIPPVSRTTPQFRNIFIENVYCYGAQTALWFQGLPEMNISNVELNNVRIEARNGAMLVDSKNVRFTNVQVFSQKSPVFYLNNVKKAKFNTVTAGLLSATNKDQSIGFQINGPFTEEIILRSISTQHIGEEIVIGTNVSTNEIKTSNK